MEPDARTRHRLLDFELGLNAASCDKVEEQEWGRAFLTPSLPLVWDASSLALEAVGLPVEAVARLADEVLGGAGFGHRIVAVCDEADGARLAAEVERLPGWEVERVEYMTWRGDSGRRAAAEAREEDMEAIGGLLDELEGEFFAADASDRVATIAQLIERDRRLGAAAGDRWFVSPAEQPQAACCLLSGDGIGQIEKVATLTRARGGGLAQAVVLAALDAARADDNEVVFIAVDGDDWPRLLYAKLGFETVGELHVLRRTPA